MPHPPQAHPDFELLADSWELTLRADGYATNTVRSYIAALWFHAGWLHQHHPTTSPLDATRDHVRAWVVHVRDTTSSGTARSWFAGVRHFYRWTVTEGERDTDPTEGIRTPSPNQSITPVIKVDALQALLKTCTGRTFLARRDTAIIYVFADGGLRLAELTNLLTEHVDVRDRMLFVEGKGTNRSGPRRRTVPLGVKAIQAVDRYLRERRRHPHHESPQLWLGDRGRAGISADGVDAMLKRRGAVAGVPVHPHMFRHTWASAFRAVGGSEGDLMVLGGWRSRSMLDRYGRAAAEDRAREAYRSRSLGDRL